MNSYSSFIKAMHLSHFYLAPLLDVTLLDFIKAFGVTKLDFLGNTWHCLHDDMFSRFDRTPTCNGQTEPQHIPC